MIRQSILCYLPGKQERPVTFKLGFESPGYFIKMLQRLAHRETRTDVARVSFCLKIEQLFSFKEQI